MPKYRVSKRFKDRFTGVSHRPEGTYETPDADRGEELQRLGYLGEEILEPKAGKGKKADAPEKSAEDAGSGAGDPLHTRTDDEGHTYVTDPETGVEFESGEGHPEHHAAADLLACMSAADLLEKAHEAGLEDVPEFEGDGSFLASCKWALAERIVLHEPVSVAPETPAEEPKKSKAGKGRKADAPAQSAEDAAEGPQEG